MRTHIHTDRNTYIYNIHKFIHGCVHAYITYIHAIQYIIHTHTREHPICTYTHYICTHPYIRRLPLPTLHTGCHGFTIEKDATGDFNKPPSPRLDWHAYPGHHGLCK